MSMSPDFYWQSFRMCAPSLTRAHLPGVAHFFVGILRGVMPSSLRCSSIILLTTSLRIASHTHASLVVVPATAGLLAEERLANTAGQCVLLYFMSGCFHRTAPRNRPILSLPTGSPMRKGICKLLRWPCPAGVCGLRRQSRSKQRSIMQLPMTIACQNHGGLLDLLGHSHHGGPARSSFAHAHHFNSLRVGRAEVHMPTTIYRTLGGVIGHIGVGCSDQNSAPGSHSVRLADTTLPPLAPGLR